MNIFFLDWNPQLAAQYHNDKHVVKMIVESTQMLSTAHRILDGEFTTYVNNYGKTKKHWQLDEYRYESNLYFATHYNHKCNVWVRESSANYLWLYRLYRALCDEFEYRYNNVHKSSMLSGLLEQLPQNIPIDEITHVPLAMNDEFKKVNPIESYRDFYFHDKYSFSIWSKRETPQWFIERMNNLQPIKK